MATTRKPTPDWALDSFERLLDHIEEAAELLHLSMRGVAVLRAMPKVVEALANAKPDDPVDGHDPQARLERAKSEASLAQREVENEFPLLHAQATVSLWGDLENSVRTFVAQWLRNAPEAKVVDAVSKLKVCLGEYEAMDEEDRCYYITERLEQELESRNRRGVARFEALLQPFGLAGAVPEDTERILFELYHVRNVLVHRRGVADRKLVQACPWLGLAPGDQVRVSHEQYARYHGAVAAYALELIVRVAGRFGFERSELIKDKPQAN